MNYKGLQAFVEEKIRKKSKKEAENLLQFIAVSYIICLLSV